MENLVIGFHVLIIGLLSFLLWRKDRALIFWPALSIKLASGILVGLLYQYYYSTGDTWTFFSDGVKVINALVENPKYFFDFFWNDDVSAMGLTLENDRPRSLYIIKWVAVFNLLDGNNYWITSLYFSFISFFSSWLLYKTLAHHFPDLKIEAAISVLFIPSIVFWGSGIIKESLAIAALNAVTSCFISWYFTRSLSIFSIVVGLFSFWVLWNLKYYWTAVWLAVVFPSILIQLLTPRVSWVSRNPKWSWGLFLFVALAGISIIHPNFYFDRILTVIIDNHNAYLKISNPDDIIHFYDLHPTLFSMLLNSPWALFSGMFRPFVTEAGTLLQLTAALENLILVVLFGMFLLRLRDLRQWNVLHLALVSYIFILCVLLALSTPNFGSLSRFKIGLTPFLWFGLLSASGVLKRMVQRFKRVG